MFLFLLNLLLYSESSWPERSRADDEIRISLEQEQYQLTHQVVFFVSAQSIRRWQNSNLFSKANDDRLGEMSVKNKADNKITFKELNVLLKHYQAMNHQLKGSGKSINDLVKLAPHQRVMRVNEFVIAEGDVNYSFLSQLMNGLLGQESTWVKGAEVMRTQDQVKFYNDKRLAKTGTFKTNSKCEVFGTRQVCSIGQYGNIVFE